MDSNKPLRQFVKDGLTGVVFALIPFAVLTIVMIFQWWGTAEFAFLLRVFVGQFFFFQYSYISPMPAVILIGFIGTGIGGLFLENIPNRWNWIIPVLIISGVSWVIGDIYFTILIGDSAPNRLWNNATDDAMLAAIAIGAGALVAGVSGVLFNPSKRFFRILIGAVASMVVGYLIGFIVFASQTN
jgi:hypothetical protein